MRQPKRNREGVEFFPGPEKPGKTLFANQPKQARAHNRHADDAGRAGAYSLRFSHRRTKNNVSDFTKAKTSIRGGRCDFRRKDGDQSCSILQPPWRSKARRPVEPPMCAAPTTTK